jgi:hypothetical protein
VAACLSRVLTAMAPVPAPALGPSQATAPVPSRAPATAEVAEAGPAPPTASSPHDARLADRHSRYRHLGTTRT